jgi:hypothetical protein
MVKGTDALVDRDTVSLRVAGILANAALSAAALLAAAAGHGGTAASACERPTLQRHML